MNINLSTYAKLLVESNLTPDAFGRKINAAIKTIFDSDDVETKKTSALRPPSFAHSYFSSHLVFNYKNIKLKIIVHFYHLKYSNSTLKNLTSQQWNDMLKSAESFTNMDTPDEILKSSNPQVKLTANIIYYPYEDTEERMSIGANNKDYVIGNVEANNIRDLISRAKKLIDDSSGDDNNGPDEPEPVTPTNPSGKLVTV